MAAPVPISHFIDEEVKSPGSVGQLSSSSSCPGGWAGFGAEAAAEWCWFLGSDPGTGLAAETTCSLAGCSAATEDRLHGPRRKGASPLWEAVGWVLRGVSAQCRRRTRREERDGLQARGASLSWAESRRGGAGSPVGLQIHQAGQGRGLLRMELIFTILQRPVELGKPTGWTASQEHPPKEPSLSLTWVFRA